MTMFQPFGGKRRPQYNRMVADVRAGRVSRIVALHVDRLNRNMRDLEGLIDLVEATGCRIDTVASGELDLNTSAGRTIARILASVAAGESERLGERQMTKQAQAREQGKSTGGPRPFGWEDLNGQLRGAEAQLIREATEHVLKGGSLQSIVRQWNAQGVKSTRGKPWDNKALSRVLTRWRNAGLISHDDEIVGKAVYPAIVSEGDVRALRTILWDPARKTSPGPTPKHLLSRIAQCENGHPMIVRGSRTTKDGKRIARKTYECTACNRSIGLDVLDKMARSAVRWFFLTTDVATLAPSEADRDTLVALRTERAEIAITEKETGERIGSGDWSTTVGDAVLKGLYARRDELDSMLGILAGRFILADMLAEPFRDPDGRVYPEREEEILKRFGTPGEDGALPLDRQRAIIRELFDIAVGPGRDPKKRVTITKRTLPGAA